MSEQQQHKHPPRQVTIQVFSAVDVRMRDASASAYDDEFVFCKRMRWRGSAARGGLQIVDVLFASRAFTLAQMLNTFYYCLPQL